MNTSFEKNKENKLLITFMEYLFWVLLILFTNPGGIFSTLNIWYIVGGFNIKDFLFVLLSICYVIIPKSHDLLDADFKKVRNYLLIFLIYYFIVFGYLTPNLNETQGYSLLTTLIKSRWTIYSILIFIYIYEFFKRRSDIFIKMFLYTSVFILILFLLQSIAKINILPIELSNRGFVNINRIYNTNISDGLMPLLIPLGITVIIFKPEIKHRNVILIGFVLMSIYYVLSITRRDIIGIFIYAFLAIVISSFIKGSLKLLFSKMLKSLVVITFIILGSYFIFPKYVEAAKIGIVESFNIIVQGKESTGIRDERLGLRPFIVSQFIENPFLGTGFDNRWRTLEGDAKGYEASDYPFLAALAMFGVIGVVVFLPIYLLLIKFLIKDFKYLRDYNEINNSFMFLFLMTFMLYFIFHLFQYINYFIPLSVSSSYTWYSFLAFYLASRSIFYRSQFQDRSTSKLAFNLA